MSWLVPCLLAAAVIAPQQEPAPARRLTAAPDRRVELDLQHYYTAQDLLRALRTLESAYPEFLRLESLGTSRGGDELWVMTVAKLERGDPLTRPAVFVAGALGRGDLFGTEMALATIIDVVQNHARDAATRELLERCVLYVAPCVDPDARARAFQAIEGDAIEGAAPAREASSAARPLDFERNFPVGWNAERWADAGPYPLCAPETRALAEFLLDHPNIAAVLGYSHSRADGESGAATWPASDLAAHARVGAAAGLASALARGAPQGGWLDFAYGELGCAAFAVELPAPVGELPPVEALLALARTCSTATVRLASALPELELGPASAERLRGDQWQVRATVRNAGQLATNTERGSRLASCPAPRVTLAGARLVAAAIADDAGATAQPAECSGAAVSLPELPPGGACQVVLFVEAPAESELALSVAAPRAGQASATVVLH